MISDSFSVYQRYSVLFLIVDLLSYKALSLTLAIGNSTISGSAYSVYRGLVYSLWKLVSSLSVLLVAMSALIGLDLTVIDFSGESAF